MIRRILFTLLAIIVVVVAIGWYRALHRPLEQAYIGERKVVLWSSMAQVRETVEILSYGQGVGVLERLEDKVRVRAADGMAGWVDQDQLIASDIWNQIGQLAARTKGMPVQGRGHTRVPSNVHLQPGRTTARIAQLGKAAEVEVLRRAVAEWSGGGEEGKEDEESASTRREDWLLVRAHPPEVGEIAGWVLARFVQYDLPDPLPDYATSANTHVTAWFQLNRVTDPHAGPKPQFLVAGTKGGEGQPCDFTQLRVYTWGMKRERYETAYVESGLCGRLPIVVTSEANGDVFFRFNAGEGGNEELTYRMHQTIVRRIRGSETAKKHHRR